MPDSTPPQLLQRTAESYGPSFQATLFDQYRGYVDSADRISARRVAANSFMLTVNSALVSLMGFSATSYTARPKWTLLTAVAGALIALTWAAMISSYARLNTAKFRVIFELEKSLPAAPYTREWHEATSKPGGTAYRAVSLIERMVPMVFFGIYGFVAARMLMRITEQ